MVVSSDVTVESMFSPSLVQAIRLKLCVLLYVVFCIVDLPYHTLHCGKALQILMTYCQSLVRLSLEFRAQYHVVFQLLVIVNEAIALPLNSEAKLLSHRSEIQQTSEFIIKIILGATKFVSYHFETDTALYNRN